MRVTPNGGPSTAQGTGAPSARRVNTGPTLHQAFSALRTIKPVARNGFDLALLRQAKIASETMDALLSLQQAGVREIHFFPSSIALLEYTFSSPDLPGLTNSHGRQFREIHSQPLTTFLIKRRYEIQGDETLLEGVFISKSVGDKLVEWDKTITRPILRIATGTTREQVETAFLSTEFPDISFEEVGLFIGYEKQAKQQAAPQPTAHRVMAAQLQEALAAKPETVAKDIKAAFGKSLDGLASGLRGLASSAEILEGQDRKPAREALRQGLRQEAARLIEQVKEDDAESAQKLAPLIALLKTLGIIRSGEMLLAEARKQDKLALFVLLNQQLIENAEPKDQALFWYLGGQLNEELELTDEALTCYREAKKLDNQKLYRAAIKQLEEAAREEQQGEIDEFDLLWRRAIEQQIKVLGKTEDGIRQAANEDFSPEEKPDKSFVVIQAKTELWQTIREDVFKAADMAKDEIFAEAALVQPLVNRLAALDLQLAVRSLENIFLSCSSAIDKTVSYSLLHTLRAELEQGELYDLCDELLYKLLDNIAYRLSTGRRTAFCEGFFFCLAIEEGLVFPQRMDGLKRMAKTAPEILTMDALMCKLFVEAIFARLVNAPLKDLVAATSKNDVGGTLRAAELYAEAVPDADGNEVRCNVLGNTAMTLAQQGKFDQALTNIEAIKAIDQSSWHIDRALCGYYFFKKEYDKAVEHGETALKKIQHDPESAGNMAKMLVSIYITRANNKPEASSEANVRRCLALAQLATTHRRFEAFGPGFAAMFHFSLKEYEQALDYIDKFIECFTTKVDHAYKTYNASRLIQTATTFIDDLYELTEKEALHKSWARIMEQIEQLESLMFAAIAEQKTLSGQGMRLVDIGRRLLFANDFAKAEKVSRLVSEFAQPESLDSNYAKFTLAELLLHTGRLQEAGEVVDELTELKGEFDHIIKGGIFTEGVPMKALIFNVYATLCLNFAPEDEPKERSRLTMEALKGYDRAGKEGLPKAVVLQQKALVYSTLGNHSQAISFWERAIKADPDFIPPYINICRTYHGDLKDLNKTEEAITSLASAIIRMQARNSSVLLDLNVYKLIIGFYINTYASETLLTLLRQLYKTKSFRPFIRQVVVSLEDAPEELRSLA